jgi:flagellar hook assembly protein FlgD
VRTLVDGKVEAGKQSVVWDGRDNAGQTVPSGQYFYTLSLDGKVLDNSKAVILR